MFSLFKTKNKASPETPLQPKNFIEKPSDFVDSRDCGLVDAVMGGWYQNDSNELFKGFQINSSDIVIDVGCGAGGATLFSARRGAHVIFTDTDANKVASLKILVAETPARKSEAIVSDSMPLPISSGTGTRIICLEVLEHVEKPNELLKELYRIGAPGALYFLSIPDPAGEMLQKQVAPAAHFKTPNHINIFTREEFSNLIAEAGFQIEGKHYYGFYWTMWMLFYWLSSDAEGKTFDDATHDQIIPPYPEINNDWAKLWHTVLRMPNGKKLRDSLDEILPKSQIIIARKPG